MRNILLNIKQVDRLEAYHLHMANVLPGYKVIIGAFQFWEEVPIVGTAQMQITDKYEGKQRLFTTTLQFLTPDLVASEGRHYCWRVTTVEGKKYLIGTDQAPFPVQANSQNFPKEYTAKSGNTVTITYNSLNPALLLLD